MTTSKADYGIDGPAIVRSLTIAGVIAIVVGIVGYVTAIPGRPVAGAVLSIVVFFLGVCMLVKVGSMMRWSKYAKLRERERLIDALESAAARRCLTSAAAADSCLMARPDESMDAVMSSLAIHNVPGKDGRAKAIREIARVLKPNGRIALQDIFATREHVETLRQLGWKDVKLSGPIFKSSAAAHSHGAEALSPERRIMQGATTQRRM